MACGPGLSYNRLARKGGVFNFGSVSQVPVAGIQVLATTMEAVVDNKQFWSIIEKSSEHAASGQDAQVAALRELLQELTVDEIVGFQRCYDERMIGSYHWDLWGAAYVIRGGCSDDGFQDFRSWLISKGESVYREALRDPETLDAAIVDDDDCQFEEFQYVASQVWEQKTRKDLSRFPTLDSEYPESPSGQEWSEEGDDLQRRFPKLWKRFGPG